MAHMVFVFIVFSHVVGTLVWFVFTSINMIYRLISGHKVKLANERSNLAKSFLQMHCAVIFFVVFSITSDAYSGVAGNESNHGKKIVQIDSVKGYPQKSINDIFSETIISEGNEENAVRNEKKKYLHVEWIEEKLSYTEYGKEIAAIYGVIPYRENTSEVEDAEKSEEIAEHKAVIEDIQNKRKSKDKLSEKDLEDEFHAYKDWYFLRPVAEIAYQAGRSSEDLFWYQINNGEDALVAAADSIFMFETFLQFKNKKVGVQPKREVCIEEILLRDGKKYYRLSFQADTEDERVHYLFCAYACFANINLNGEQVLLIQEKNENVLLAEYYRGLTIANLPLNLVDENLLEELKSSIYIADMLLEQNVNLEEKFQQKEEENLPELLEGLRETIPRIEKWIN